MVSKTLKIISKTNDINIVTPQDLLDIQYDIQRGNDMLLEDFGSQENVDAHLQEVKEELYQKLFSNFTKIKSRTQPVRLNYFSKKIRENPPNSHRSHSIRVRELEVSGYV